MVLRQVEDDGTAVEKIVSQLREEDYRTHLRRPRQTPSPFYSCSVCVIPWIWTESCSYQAKGACVVCGTALGDVVVRVIFVRGRRRVCGAQRMFVGCAAVQW